MTQKTPLAAFFASNIRCRSTNYGNGTRLTASNACPLAQGCTDNGTDLLTITSQLNTPAYLLGRFDVGRGISAAGSISRASARASIVSRRADRLPRSIRLMWVRCRPAASARASWDISAASRSSLIRFPNAMTNAEGTVDKSPRSQTIRPQTMRNIGVAPSAPDRQSDAMPSLDHNRDASYREKVVEHLLVGELLRHLWERGVVVEVLKPEVDAEGYDVVFEVQGVTRHVQLKASHASSKTARVNVHASLSSKPSGCVVWSVFEPGELRFQGFRFFGAAPGQPMPDIADLSPVRHSRADASGQKGVRERLRAVPRGRFEELGSVAELAGRLFGDSVTET